MPATPDKKPAGAPASPAGSGGQKPIKTKKGAYFSDFGFTVAIVVIVAGTYLSGYDLNRAFLNVEVALSACLVVPLVWLIARRNSIWRVLGGVLSAVVGAGIVCLLYLAICGGFILLHYSAAQSAPAFANQYFELVDKDNTGLVTNNQLAAISQEQFALGEALSNVDSDVRSLQDTPGIPAATKNAVLQHYQSIRQDIVTAQLPQAEVESINAQDICAAGHPINNGTDCAASRDELLTYKARLEQQYPRWFALFRWAKLLP